MKDSTASIIAMSLFMVGSVLGYVSFIMVALWYLK